MSLLLFIGLLNIIILYNISVNVDPFIYNSILFLVLAPRYQHHWTVVLSLYRYWLGVYAQLMYIGYS